MLLSRTLAKARIARAERPGMDCRLGASGF